MLTQTEMPADWQTSAVVRYLDAPYSDEALADPNKAPIDAGAAVLSGLKLGAHADGVKVKKAGSEFDLDSQSEYYQILHRTFFDAARLILSEEQFLDSSVYFDHSSATLKEGETATFWLPHMDGVYPGFMKEYMSVSYEDRYKTLRFFGTARNVLPTGLLQGSVTKEDFSGESGTHLKSGVSEAKQLRFEELPLGRVNILAPATIHFAQRAPEFVPESHFLRWQLFF